MMRDAIPLLFANVVVMYNLLILQYYEQKSFIAKLKIDKIWQGPGASYQSSEGEARIFSFF